MNQRIIEVWYNWHQGKQEDRFMAIKLGDTVETTHGVKKCTKIERAFNPNGMYVIFMYEDGSQEEQWNINKIIFESVE